MSISDHGNDVQITEDNTTVVYFHITNKMDWKTLQIELINPEWKEI